MLEIDATDIKMLRNIESISIQPDEKLLLLYSTGDEVVVDFKPMIAMGGVFRSLAEPRFFAQVKVGEGGRFIEWPGGLDFCADALWQQARLASSSENEAPDLQNVDRR